MMHLAETMSAEVRAAAGHRRKRPLAGTSLLYVLTVRPNDAMVIAAVAALLAAVAILASLRPAIRATAIALAAVRQE